MLVNSLRYAFVFLTALLIISSCKKDPPINPVHNLNNGNILAFGHGGMGIAFKYPMNSYESFEPCFRIGAEGSDVDVQMTKDCVLVLYHHQKLEDGTDAVGILNSKTWEEIKNTRYASPFSNSIDLIPLTFLLDKLNLNEVVLTLDCKLYKAENADYGSYISSFKNELVKVMGQYNISHSSLIESNDTNFIRLLKTEDPSLKLFIYPQSFSSGLTIADKMDIYGITISTHLTSKTDIEQAHQHGRRVTLWNVSSENDNVEAIDKSPDYIQSDKIIHLLKIFDRYKKQGLKNLKW